ncbi:MAG: roadblock/LC7 domain-containing protein [Candidatus Thermoplasmatota archaeon]|nr:roadblock/LC7 domain-containing protein [Candidatus Thermoplasmatota archaeon]
MQDKQYRNILSELESSADIDHSFIVSRDGLLIYPEKCSEFNPDAFAAMTATLLAAAEAAMDELNGGVPIRVVVKANNFNIITTGAGPRAILAVITSSNDIDTVHEAMKKAAKEIDEIL